MSSIISQIQAIIDEADRMRSSYYFTPPKQAGARRSYEKQHSHDEVQWQDGKDVFTAQYVVSCSCSNVYAKGVYTKNGQKTTLTAVKNSLKRLQKEV